MVTKKKLLQEIAILHGRVDYLSKRCDILEFKNEAKGELYTFRRARVHRYTWVVNYIGGDRKLHAVSIQPAPSQWVKPVANGRFLEFWFDGPNPELLEVYQIQENKLVKVDLELYKNYIKESEKEDV